jgi:hypothetical protein
MRLWTVHPRYLDPKGLVAAWREALLAQKVISGATKGYCYHPQLARFQAQTDPPAAIASFLVGLADEAQMRGYHFDVSKISPRRFRMTITVTSGQLLYEWAHLMTKLRTRAPLMESQLQNVTMPEPHPLFCVVPGEVCDWERT